MIVVVVILGAYFVSSMSNEYQYTRQTTLIARIAPFVVNDE